MRPVTADVGAGVHPIGVGRAIGKLRGPKARVAGREIALPRTRIHVARCPDLPAWQEPWTTVAKVVGPRIIRGARGQCFCLPVEWFDRHGAPKAWLGMPKAVHSHFTLVFGSACHAQDCAFPRQAGPNGALAGGHGPHRPDSDLDAALKEPPELQIQQPEPGDA